MQRYLTRPLDPHTFEIADLSNARWSDYAGSAIFSDYTVDVIPPEGEDPPTLGQINLTRGHEPGLGRFTGGPLHVSTYAHGNLIGTTEAESATSGGLSARQVFTAFGEPVYATQPVQAANRYGYAGAWGYDAGQWAASCGPSGQASLSCDPVAALGWIHVGERYYDPASGRFVQRDPIGIDGGFNVYVYCNVNPLNCVDPLGLDRYYVREQGHSSVWIEDPDRPGGYIQYDLGVGTGVGCVVMGPGTLPDPKKEIVIKFRSTIAQDREDIDRLNYAVKTGGPGWRPWRNCINWACYWANLHQNDPPPRPNIGWPHGRPF